MKSSTRVWRVLVVEDIASMALAVNAALRRHGCQCVTVPSGEEASARLDADDFDLVIADVRMPGMTGLDLLRDVKRRHPGIPVILMTAYGDPTLGALAPDADGFLRKPFGIDELWATVARALGVSPGMDEDEA